MTSRRSSGLVGSHWIVAGTLVCALACAPLACSSSDSDSGLSGATSPADRLKQDTGATWVVTTSKQTGKVDFLAPTGPTASLLTPGVKPEDAAMAFLEKYKDLFGFDDPKSELSVYAVDTDDDDGSYHVVFDQVAGGGVPVVGSGLAFHFTTTGSVAFIVTSYVPALGGVASAKPALDAAAARAKADADFSAHDASYRSADAVVVDAPTLVVYPAGSARVLAWRMMLATAYPREVVVDAVSGAIVASVDRRERAGAVATALTGYGARGDAKSFEGSVVGSTYLMYRPGSTSATAVSVRSPLSTRGSHVVAAASASGPWDLHFLDPRRTKPSPAGFGTGVDTMSNVEQVDAWYRTAVRRRSYDGAGTPILVQLHDNASGPFNAFWQPSDKTIHVGDGYNVVVTLPGGLQYGTQSQPNGDDTYPPAVCLDVIGHEFTHAVTDAFDRRATRLDRTQQPRVYGGQSGALDESQADIFGSFIEHQLRPGGKNLVIAEDAYPDGSGLRDLLHPHLSKERQPDNMKDLVTSSNDENGDFGGVHANTGIPNNAFALATVGGTNDTSQVHVVGEGWDASLKVWWRFERHDMHSASSFELAAKATIGHAQQVSGANLQSVVCAWYAVGVVDDTLPRQYGITCDAPDAGDDAAPPPPPPPPPDMDASATDVADVNPDATEADVDAGPPTDHCTGRADGTYCSVTSQKFFAVVCKNQQLWGAEYCPNPNTQVCAGPNGPGDIVCQ